jgi:hypothetical protein
MGLIAPLVKAVQNINSVFNATGATTTQSSILSLYQGTSSPAVTIDQFGNLSIGTSTATSTTSQEFCLNGSCITSLPFATSTALAGQASSTPSFASDFLNALEHTLAQWFAQASNGIDQFFANVGNFHTVNTQQVNVQTICVGDSPTDPSPICLTKAQLAALLSQTASAQTPESVSSSAPQNSSTNFSESVSSATSSQSQSATSDTPPQIQINGDNPAVLQVGDSYTDLGATITGPQQDLNLGTKTYLNGALTSNIVIDTTETATDTIDYVATDQSGLTSTSTRTVIIEAPSIVPNADASSTATTTTQ